MRACVRACVHECVRACVRAGVRVCVRMCFVMNLRADFRFHSCFGVALFLYIFFYSTDLKGCSHVPSLHWCCMFSLAGDFKLHLTAVGVASRCVDITGRSQGKGRGPVRTRGITKDNQQFRHLTRTAMLTTRWATPDPSLVECYEASNSNIAGFKNSFIHAHKK